jgi:hypothetical protein
VTQTVYHTIYSSGFKKRTGTLSRDFSPNTARKANGVTISHSDNRRLREHALVSCVKFEVGEI